jgi:uncharacterized protein (TIGR03643 family)
MLFDSPFNYFFSERNAMAAPDLDAELDSESINRIIEMAWEDRTPFEAIALQFGLSEKQVIALMRREMKPSSFRLWRRRMRDRTTKHLALRSFTAGRFRSQNQR